ncbi:MAG TPA: hypothetical protein PLF40_07590 [Kofleriaceae bacterium]|nr:hypothetical protein [Kofleriaceae bacterium]
MRRARQQRREKRWKASIGVGAAEAAMKPRCNLAGSIVFVTRRCTQRQFLLRPDGTLNNNFLYCALYAASVYKIGLIALTVESNHYHVTAHDPEAQISAFMERLDGLAARSINCLRGPT